MPLLAAAVAIVAVLCLLDLLLTLGVIRRLREHERRLAEAGSAPPRRRLDPGAPVGPFSATATDGSAVSADALAPRAVVAFFSPTCAPCAEQLPRFVDLVAALPGGPGQALAVVCGDLAQAGPLVAKLEPVARVVLEEGLGPLATAFGVFAFPTLYVVDRDGAIRASGGSVDTLRDAMGGESFGAVAAVAGSAR